MALFYLVRHGETVWNQERRLQGQTDIPLSEEGRDQARKVAARLASIRFDDAFSSTLSRAADTANLIVEASAAPLSLRFHDELREASDGIFEGLSVSEAAERDPRLVDRTGNDGPAPDFAPPQGESIREFYERQRGVASNLLGQFVGAEQVLVVGHGWVFRALAAAMLDLGVKEFWKLRSPQPASVSIIETAEGRAAIRTWGDDAHLVSG